MFGLFKKKDKPEKPLLNNDDDNEEEDDDKKEENNGSKKVIPSAKAQPFIARWEDLLERIKQKATSMLKEAEEKSQALVNDTLYDTQAINQFWTAIQHKVVHSLGEKIEEGYTKLDELTSEADLTTDDYDFYALGILRDEASRWLEIEYQRYYVKVLAKAALKIWENAMKEEVVKHFKCSSCGAPLDLHKQIFKAINLKCNFCSFVNTYEPPHKMSMAEGFAMDPLCNEAAFDIWEKMQKIGLQIDRETDHGKKASVDTLDKYEAAALEYWTIWYKKREGLVPEYSHQTQGGIDSKMEWVWKDLRKSNNQWVSKIKK